jgi:serine/threonine protein kinase
MGTVYLGRDPDLDRSVAIKVLREPLAEDELLQRFLREARATASLRHENLVTIYQVGEHEHQPFIAMEYVDGTTLSDIIKQRQPLPVAQKLSYLEQICAGLHHAHRSGIVHRDIKPANVMVDSQGVIRILDFGIARVANSGMTSDGSLMGTLNYMSPEQMVGRPVDYRSDIFSVGALAYELLSYHQAFPGTMNDGLLHRLPNEAPAPFAQVSPGLPADLEGIVLRALAKTPQDRFADLDEMRTAVHRARRSIDPQLQLETVVIPSRNKQRPSTRPASSEERRALLERRARQIALHRDAARAALARGDLDGAAAACDDALTLDPDDQEAAQLLSEIQQAKEDREQDHGREPAPPASVSSKPVEVPDKTDTRGSWIFAVAAAAVVVLAIGGVVVWMMGTDEGTAPSPQAASSIPTPEPVPPSVATGGGDVAAAQPPPPATPAPAPATPPPAPGAVDPLDAPLARIDQLYRKSDLETAITELDRIGPSSDSRVTARGASIWQAAARSMDEAHTAADSQKAADLAQKTYASAEQARRLAGTAASRNDYVQSSRQALVASAAYRRAESEARLAAAAVPPPTPAKPAAAPVTAAATPPPTNPAPIPEPTPPPARVETPTPARTESPAVAAAPSPPPAAVASAVDREGPGILRALKRYEDAYEKMNVDAIAEVYTGLLRETSQDLKRQFQNCRAYDVTFANTDVTIGNDPTAATVSVRTTYTCTPKSRQEPLAYTSSEVFKLRKVRSEWFIEERGSLDSGTRRR